MAWEEEIMSASVAKGRLRILGLLLLRGCDGLGVCPHDSLRVRIVEYGRLLGEDGHGVAACQDDMMAPGGELGVWVGF